MGGDEFLLIFMEIESVHDIASVAEIITKAVQVPRDIRVRDISISLVISPSIGISIFPKDATTADALLDSAEKAMYRARRDKHGYSFAGGN